MDEPRRITIVDPSRPAAAPVDELDAEAPRSRRGLYALLAALVVLAALRVGDTVLDRRAAAAAERRQAAVVELELTERFSGQGSSSRSPSDTVEVMRSIGLRNTGPRPVEVLSVTYGPLRFSGSRVLEAGREEALQLTAEASCATRPADVVLPATVAVQARSAAGEVVERQVPLPDQLFLADVGELRRGCGYLEVFEATYVGLSAVGRRGRSIEVLLDVANTGRTEVRLVSVVAGAGMAVEVSGTAEEPSAGLPLLLPANPDGQLDLRSALELRLTVADCDAVVMDAQPFDGEAPSSLRTTFEDEAGQTTTTFSALEGGEAEALVREVCG